MDVNHTFHSSDDAVLQIASLVDSGQLDLAAAVADQALGSFPDDWRLHQQKARALEKSAFADDDPLSAADLCLRSASSYIRAAALVSDADPQRTLILPALICQSRGLQDKADEFSALKLSRCLLKKADAMPAHPLAIVVSTLPKSASAYIYMALATGLNLRPERISTTGSETDTVDIERLEKLASRGGFVAQGHFYPTEYNLIRLSLHLRKLVVHVRDPRQTILSWAHYVQQPIARTTLQGNSIWTPWLDKPLADRIDRAIEKLLPGQLDYLKSWTDAIDNKKIKCSTLITRQDDLVMNPLDFFSTILDFFDVDKSAFTPPQQPQKGELHFRTGDPTEWRREFSAAQMARIQSQVPDSILERFGWDR